jgi:nitrite reductase/ring-hydroxylating ferredoxin subunit
MTMSNSDQDVIAVSGAELRLVKVCAVDDVDEEDCLQVELEDEALPALAVYRVGGDEVYVSDDLCSHGKASLGDEGYLEGHIIECTWHEGKFDIRTGEPVALPCEKAIKVYPVTVKDGDVFISVEIT